MIFFDRYPVKGVCPAGGQHSDANSFYYGVHHDLTGAGLQSGWKRCRKCVGLFYGPFQGKCPAGGTHDAQGSLNYWVRFV
jgi:hypothetical protein